MADNCKTFRAEIEKTEGGAPLSRGGEAHLGECGPCREFRRQGESLARLLGELERVSAPADFEFRLRARMAAGRKGPRTPISRLKPVFATACAACVLLVTASIFFRGGGREAGVTSDRPAAVIPQAHVPDEGARSRETGGDELASRAGADAVTTTAATEVNGGLDSPPAAGSSRDGVRRGRGPRAKRAVESEDFSQWPNRVIEPSGLGVGQVASHRSPIAVPLNASEEPMRVVLRDEHGAAYKVQMRTVSFGAEEFVSRRRAATPASFKDQEGVW